jgi:hypothetical protein
VGQTAFNLYSPPPLPSLASDGEALPGAAAAGATRLPLPIASGSNAFHLVVRERVHRAEPRLCTPVQIVV